MCSLEMRLRLSRDQALALYSRRSRDQSTARQDRHHITPQHHQPHRALQHFRPGHPMLEQAQRPHELTVVPRSHLPHLRRAEIPRPASPAIMALLIPNAHEVCAEFLDGVGGLAWLDGFRVVRDEQGLFGFDYDDAFSALYRHSNIIVSTPVAFAFAWGLRSR